MIDWTHWHNEPYLIGGLLFAAWLYAILTGPLRSRIAAPTTTYPRAHAVRFYAAIVIFYLAVGSPLDQMGEQFLLSAHMVQHQLLIYGSALLVLLGLPPWLVAPLTRPPALRGLLRFLTNPIIANLIYTLTISLWHAPAAYDFALRNKLVHIAEHVMFFAVGLLYWWPIVSPSSDVPRLKPAAQMLYLISVTITMTPLFAFIAFSDNILYPTYEFAPRLIANFGAAQDQLLGAAIMKLGGMLVTFLALAVAFMRWYRESNSTIARPSPR